MENTPPAPRRNRKSSGERTTGDHPIRLQRHVWEELNKFRNTIIDLYETDSPSDITAGIWRNASASLLISLVLSRAQYWHENEHAAHAKARRTAKPM